MTRSLERVPEAVGATHVIVTGFYLCRPTLRWLSVNYRVDIKPRHIEA